MTAITTLIAQLNQSDKAYETQNTPKLAHTRASIRKQLANFSKHPKEKQLFLNQALIILEQALLTFEEMPITTALQLNLLLADCYLSLYEIDKKAHYLIISEQIIKPLAHHNYRPIYELLSHIHHLQNKPKLSQHWQNKAKTAKEFSIFENFIINQTIH